MVPECAAMEEIEMDVMFRLRGDMLRGDKASGDKARGKNDQLKQMKLFKSFYHIKLFGLFKLFKQTLTPKS